MNGTLSLFGRGLLVLALSGLAVACGDDDGGGGGGDDAGLDGGGSGGSGGNGGRAGSGGAGSGGDDGGGPSVDECVEAVDMNTGGGVTEACAMCVCENGAQEAVDCNGDCWGLIVCFDANCSQFTPGTPQAQGCAISNCMQFIGEATPATALGAIITADCSEECEPAPTGDGGTDDGGT